MSDRYKYSILDVSAALHCSVTGSCEGCHSPAELNELADWLERRIAAWVPSLPCWKAWDDAVLTLARTALADFRGGA